MHSRERSSSSRSAYAPVAQPLGRKTRLKQRQAYKRSLSIDLAMQTDEKTLGLKAFLFFVSLSDICYTMVAIVLVQWRFEWSARKLPRSYEARHRHTADV